ncbi:hypothetical protein IQ274_17290 [Nostoc sp. LEGE 12447]|uniref:hypothetical protein n=1 Tax=Nostoc sp. LEGE 12447 TaxID=1828640 RepID=UPI001883829E|nr:hypothetical protein [Nostoc sp. LEGE 12447]MBE8999942.1 hypothetical protein [Nostoc sp. LEGE 12447]
MRQKIMSDQIITSDLLVELSTDEQQLLCGGQFIGGFDGGYDRGYKDRGGKKCYRRYC